jgi:DNA polymerase (family X)
MTNYEIADHLSLLSQLMDIHGENSFKAKSFAVTAYKVEKLEDQLGDLTRPAIMTYPGIGDSSAKKIIELLDTGKIKALKELINKTPAGVLEMMKIKGLGPKKVSIVWKEMGIESIGELLYACHENRLLLYKGFGKKTQQNVIEAIEFYQQHQGNYLYAQVEQLADSLLQYLHKLLNTPVHLTGKMRRHAETIDMLEYLAEGTLDIIDKALSGEEEFVQEERTNDHILYNYDGRIKAKFYAAERNEIAKKLFLTTGSEIFLDALQEQLSVIDSKPFSSETEIFKTLKLEYVEPYLRESEEIITLAGDNKLPMVIQPEDIKAIIHSHSDWSDGGNTIEELSKAAIKKGLEYLVISDHSKTAYYANGLPEEKIIAQHKLVDELNKKLTPFKIFKSIESDILSDGSLDYSDEILKTFDLVIASVHSNLKMDQEKAMKRLVAAIENPYTIILGHMTGRLLLSRSGYKVDYKKIIDACAANYVVIEHNAHPRRLDMRWQWIPYALAKGVLLSIDPDAHSTVEFDNTRYGVLAAQKGMLTKENNLSSFSLKEFEDYLFEVRTKKGTI